jgi:hypothetical protein
MQKCPNLLPKRPKLEETQEELQRVRAASALSLAFWVSGLVAKVYG